MTDTVIIERALIVMAVCLVVQTALITAGFIATFVAWRRTRVAIDAQVAELRLRVDRVSDTVDRVSDNVEQAAQAFQRSVGAVHDAVDGTRDAVKSAVAIVGSPKAAVALGALRGLQWWRRYRADQRAHRAMRQPRLIVDNRVK